MKCGKGRRIAHEGICDETLRGRPGWRAAAGLGTMADFGRRLYRQGPGSGSGDLLDGGEKRPDDRQMEDRPC